ncbi:MAG: menaquinol-cytochrome C reductase [Chloroflexi bacterium]|nr:menaquinol-cytochrome C reductase [Chloroflexota bacterium]
MQERRVAPANVQIRAERARAHRLLALVKGETAPKVQKAPEDSVLTWPYFLMLEFLCAAVFTIGLLLLSFLVNAPLGPRADVNFTPNPSKAPWYFLNLQEMLLHMHPALAGVYVPGGLLLALMALPYLDRSQEGLGVWFGTVKSKAIALISAIYAVGLNAAMIVFDEYIGVKRIFRPLLEPLLPLTGPAIIDRVMDVVIPMGLLFGLSGLLLWFVKWRYRASSRELAVAFFSGFIATYVILTIIGTAFRGTGMHLFWPWELPPTVEF